MASDQQVSLAVAPRGSSTHLNRPARQVVPAFLQKLYEMVNDPADHDLIRWSDAGDSFFVMDQERFASEVLGRWFKHKNFSSFVRQLNMYGFHKIPHLQQGVLRSDSDTEFWNFEHPHFLRGQPDMLCLIQRKKQATNTQDEPSNGARDAANTSGAVGALSAGQLLDINSIFTGISAIKRHQAAISADLNELKSSNQHLWQEAMAARERHKKHQDTINRILKFLAGVFGHGDSPIHKDDSNHSQSQAVVARKPQRLLIGNGRIGTKKGIEINEIVDEEPRTSFDQAQSPSSLHYFSADTPTATSATVPSVPPSEPFGPSRETSPRFASVDPPSPSNNAAETVGAQEPYPQATHTIQPNATYATPPQQSLSSKPSQSTSLTTTNGSSNNNDAMVQAALTSVMQSPAQMQKLLAALSSQTHYAIPEAPIPQPSSQLAPYDAHMDVSRTFAPEHFAASYNPSPLSLLSAPAQDQVMSLDSMAQNEERLQKTYQNASEINADVDTLSSSIHSLIESLGIDPSTLGTSGDGTMGASDIFSMDGGTHDIGMPSDLENMQGEFDFNSFLTDLSRGDEGDADLDRLADRLDPSTTRDTSPKLPNPSPEQLHAFLDEVASQDGTETPLPRQPHGSPATQTSRARKRKSDVIDVGNSNYPTTGSAANEEGNKIKRKR
ncbi:hypothetical protein BV22DRAFT_1097134 [Leucogyrophana mollusca]|uniref:Uncharacterized protein n=1 Tax=Leucogyrophana mollusca TaxID=85980 RepID=A0ACB8B832_9AGAM|nr:hypothetical protein BV22DRAFT_1097134 [Leucogyrophana mollusca]